MDPSYSLRIPQKEPVSKKKTRKRKVINVYRPETASSHKYVCYQCSADVYFLPGHELVCATCASRIVEKVRTNNKRVISATLLIVFILKFQILFHLLPDWSVAHSPVLFQ